MSTYSFVFRTICLLLSRCNSLEAPFGRHNLSSYWKQRSIVQFTTSSASLVDQSISYNFTQNAITLTVANSSIIIITFLLQKMKLVSQYRHDSSRITHFLFKCSWRCFCNGVSLQPLFVHFTFMKPQSASCIWKKRQNKSKAFITSASFQPNESGIFKMVDWVALETKRKVHKTMER